MLHGLSVEMAEALAELWHRRIREEWGFADEDGPTLAGLFRSSTAARATRGATPRAPTSRTRRRSPSCSRSTASASTLTEEFHLVPEQSTSAIIVPHPEAKYFVV